MNKKRLLIEGTMRRLSDKVARVGVERGLLFICNAEHHHIDADEIYHFTRDCDWTKFAKLEMEFR